MRNTNDYKLAKIIEVRLLSADNVASNINKEVSGGAASHEE